MKNESNNNPQTKAMPYDAMLAHVFERGQKVYVKAEKRPYTVRACDDRFAICTKPFNPQKTVQYFIVDKKRNVRGTENLIFGMGFETDEECNDALDRLQKGESEVSYRNFVVLDIVRVVNVC